MHLMESAKLYPIMKTPEKNPLLPSQNNQEIDGWQYQNASAPTLSRVNTQKEQAKPQITQNVDKDTQTEQCYIGPVNAKTANGAQKVAYPELDPLHATLDDYLDEKSSMNESFSDEHIPQPNLSQNQVYPNLSTIKNPDEADKEHYKSNSPDSSDQGSTYQTTQSTNTIQVVSHNDDGYEFYNAGTSDKNDDGYELYNAGTPDSPVLCKRKKLIIKEDVTSENFEATFEKLKKEAEALNQ
uniref:Uncharacterized protein n=1 Tax=Acrobeloides nanus TaxID=290746 RepID=A0A914EP67_9BILA